MKNKEVTIYNNSNISTPFLMSCINITIKQEYNLYTKRTTYEGKRIHLTKREFSFLSGLPVINEFSPTDKIVP